MKRPNDMMDTRDLGDVYVEYMGKLKSGEINKEFNTGNEFYDYAGILTENRSDLATAAILNQLVKRKEINLLVR